MTHLQTASDAASVKFVAGMQKPKHRSGCPVSTSLEILGDRWSLLIVRDLMVRGHHTFKDFQESGERIASNVLSDRLRTLQSAGIITAEVVNADRRRLSYRLTEKGIDLAPLLLEMLIWGARHEQTETPCAVIEDLERNRAGILAESRRRWQERDRTPLIPRFNGDVIERNFTRRRRAN